MKKNGLIIILAFITFSINVFGQNSFVGKIVMNGNPCPPPPDECPPGLILWLETTSLDYVLTINSNWIWEEKLTFDGIEYWEEDEVEITGTVTFIEDVFTKDIYELEIESIKKIEEGIVVPSKPENKVYYDVVNQLLIFDETLQKQSLTLELYDLQGRVVLKPETGRSVSIAHLPTGVYVFRITTKTETITQKIIKQ